jgi:hypothetical protein
MANKTLPTPEQLRQLLCYDPATGDLTWKERDTAFFKDGIKTAIHNCRVWNNNFSGKSAGSYTSGTGYGEITILRHALLIHRVVWAYYYGEWPERWEHIDHINHDRADNRICNLRLVTRQDNQRNLSIRSDNSTGVSGVRFDKRPNRSKPWIVRMRHNGKAVHVGCFATLEDATKARNAFAQSAGYHENHGLPPTL